MRIARSNIAIILAILFAFPPIFQSFHIVSHHSTNKYKKLIVSCKAHCTNTCEKEKLLQTDENEQICLICHYQFSVNFLSDNQIHSTLLVTAKEISDIFSKQKSQKQSLSLKSPRAPPYNNG